MDTAATIALALAQQMMTTKQPNTGMLQPDSPIPAAQVVGVWIQGMPESVDFVDSPAWDATTTPGNQTDLVDPNSIGCSLAYMSASCSLGVSLDAFAFAIGQNPKLALSSVPNTPTWQEFIYMMESVADWQQTNDPFNVWLPKAAPTGAAQAIVAAVAQAFSFVPTNAQAQAAVNAVAAILQPAAEPTD